MRRNFFLLNLVFICICSVSIFSQEKLVKISCSLSERQPEFCNAIDYNIKNYLITFFNSLDNPNISKKISEPKEALRWYYIRLRLSSENGNSPRYPLIIVEVNKDNMKLIKSSVITLDSLRLEDKIKGELEKRHVNLLKDRTSKNIIVVSHGFYSKNTKRDWVTIRLKVS